jgi:4-cresol dehydrogenase (hydroxylating)
VANTDTLSEAFQAWASALGEQHVFTTGEPVATAQRATFHCERRIAGIIFPGTTAEVQQCVRIAAQYRVPIYPISRGKNWGLGSCLPAADDCVIMNLRRMNRIISYNEELSYLTVEPGVTFVQGSEFLRQRNSRHYLCVIGGPPDGSLIGNALERGDGAGKYGERSHYACSLEVVLGTGEVIHTGLGRFGQALAGPVHRYGVGPAMDGLFSQSNFGIVTQATFWLPRKPPEFQSVLFTIADEEALLPLVEQAKELMGLGVLLPNSLAIWNAYKFATTDHQYPWASTGGKKPLRPEQLDSVAGPWRGAKWIGVAGLYSASRSHARADRALLRQRLKPLVHNLLFVDRTKARLATMFRRPLKALGLDVDSVVRVLFAEPIFAGYTTLKSVSGCYWRKRVPVPPDPDPDRDRCGVLWLCPAVPFTAEHIRKSVALCTEISLKHGFEPQIAITFPSERCVYVLPSLLYDRDDAADEQGALKCHDEMFEALLHAGYYPHRLGIQSMGMLPPCGENYAGVWQRLKNALDPAGILSPGRYVPR